MGSTKVLFSHVNSIHKKYIIKDNGNDNHNVCGFIRINNVWKQYMNKNMNQQQLGSIMCRVAYPRKCNPNCQL